MALYLYLKKAEYIGQLCLRLTFNDGSERSIDFMPFFNSHSHPQYNKYSDPAKFRKFTIENGNVVWGKNWDLMFPIEQLYSGTV